MKLRYLLLALLLILPITYAITGSIGNAKAIVNVQLDDGSKTLSRNILVKNVNNQTVNIKLEIKDEIADLVNIIDKEFSLAPYEEKRAQYQVMLDKPGIYNGQIVVFFESTAEKSPGVALPASLTFRVSDKDGNIPNIINNDSESDDSESDDETNDNYDSDTGVTVGVGGGSRIKEDVNNYALYSFLVLLGLVVATIVVYFIRKL